MTSDPCELEVVICILVLLFGVEESGSNGKLASKCGVIGVVVVGVEGEEVVTMGKTDKAEALSELSLG